jgi:chromosome segregation ATPase
MRYLLGYFALMLTLSGLGMLASGEILGLFLLVIAAILIYLIMEIQRGRRRARRFGDYGPAIEGYEKRFTAAEKSLESKLPEDALESPALVELMSGEDADSAEAIREEYGRLRQRFVAWQEDFAHMRAQNEAGAIGLPERFAEHYDRLDQQLSELLGEVERLEARAEEAGRASDDPLEEIARAALKLEQATSKCRRAFGDDAPPELESHLRLGGEKLEQARAALAKDAERPVAAARLAREAGELAALVEKRAEELVKLPGELTAKRAALDATCDRLEVEISEVKAKLRAAAEVYAPSCLLAIRGFGASAEQAIVHARSLISKQAGSTEAYLLEQAEESLGRTADLVKQIEEHLTSLDHAALQARHDVEQAELEIDRAWAAANAASTPADQLRRSERVIARAQEIVRDARKELEQGRPDWFRVLALANRASDVVHELAPSRPTESEAPTGSHPNVELARARAEAALAEARTIVTMIEGAVGPDNVTSLFLDRGEAAYAKAVALEKQIAAAEDPEALMHAVLDGFRLAEDAAAAAHEHALGLRGIDGTKSSSHTTVTVLWGGKLGAAFGSD